ncbi:MAG: hydrogenase maturation protein [Rhodocyclaceae bacterium]|nr:hydrogenase maturation protein [Rhodocyclaceae bacterium]
MRILFLVHDFNSLGQRLHAELAADGHDLSVEFDIRDSVTEEAVASFAPDVVLAPFLKRAIPASIWTKRLCLVVHPGIVGDRGPSALDWAVQQGEIEWGVTVLQANGEIDAGDIWASRRFPMRAASKASLYRREVGDAALACVREALARVDAWRHGCWRPIPLAVAGGRGRLRPLMRQVDRHIDWRLDDTATVLAKLRAGDGFPGVADRLFGETCHLYDAHPGPPDIAGEPGACVARREGAILRRTVDGSVWIGHVRRKDSDVPIKRPATEAFAAQAALLPERPAALVRDHDDHGELRYEESADGSVGFLSFAFYNGAMGSEQCHRLEAAIAQVAARPTRVLVFTGGPDFWSNGIHLNRIEAAESAADESWRNIVAMDDVCAAIINLSDRLTVAALRGSAAAGGCFLALAADQVWAHPGVVLNPHYRNMGNLYGSEYWTYLLPRRLGPDRARQLAGGRLPLTAAGAAEIGLIDACFGSGADDFEDRMRARALGLAAAGDLAACVQAKAARRAADEAAKPLAAYRDEELAQMHRNFYGFDPSYHVARYRFVHKIPPSWTPRHLARHRQPGWRPVAGSAP